MNRKLFSIQNLKIDLVLQCTSQRTYCYAYSKRGEYSFSFMLRPKKAIKGKKMRVLAAKTNEAV